MSAYLIYAEGETQGGGLTEKLGIGEIEGGESNMTWVQSKGGPAGPDQMGLVGAWVKDAAVDLPVFNPSKQEWRRAPGGKFWVGVWNDRPLSPEDIQRKRGLAASIPVTLEDGQQWAIPVAKALPHIWGMDDEGQRVRNPRREFVVFCEQAEEVYQAFVHSARGESFQITCEWDFVCQALSINYKLSPAIVSALGLIGDLTGGVVLAAVIEWRGIEEAVDQKKTSESVIAAATPSS